MLLNKQLNKNNTQQQTHNKQKHIKNKITRETKILETLQNK